MRACSSVPPVSNTKTNIGTDIGINLVKILHFVMSLSEKSKSVVRQSSFCQSFPNVVCKFIIISCMGIEGWPHTMGQRDNFGGYLRNVNGHLSETYRLTQITVAHHSFSRSKGKAFPLVDNMVDKTFVKWAHFKNKFITLPVHIYSYEHGLRYMELFFFPYWITRWLNRSISRTIPITSPR